MPDLTIPTPAGDLSMYVTAPTRPGPRPGVVVVHDATGMSSDLRHQADWLAGAGYLVAAPDLLKGGTILRCLREMIFDYVTWQGRVFAHIEAVRRWLLARDDCNGKVGVIGFCMGGSFALLLAPGHGFAASSVNYGQITREMETLLKDACPIVASYGARDRSLRGAAGRLETILSAAGIDHDVKEYPDAGHGFLNQHAPGEVPMVLQVMGNFVHTAYHEPSAIDARRRIVAFFDTHLY